MKWYAKLIVILALLALAAVIFGMVYVVTAKNNMNEYNIQSGAVFNAAMLINGETTYTDAEHAVIASYEGEKAVVIPENYKSLLFYLRQNAGWPLYIPVHREHALTIDVCGQSVFTVDFDANGEDAAVELITENKTFVMHIRGIALKERLLKCAMEGTFAGENLTAE